MKKILPLIAALAIISCGSNKTKPIEGSLLTEAEVKDFILAYDKAWATRDTTAMKELMDERYIYFTSTGATLDRNNVISWFTPADKYKVDSASRNEIAVTVSGNTAIVNSRWVGSGSFGEERFDDDQRCGLVVQKINGKVKLISEHCVQIGK